MIYSLVLTSIFLTSIAAVCIQPAAGAKYSFGVPKEAKGLKLQSEVKVYDKDQWGNSLGYCADQTCNYKYGGDGTSANNVGARSQSKISDWETEDRWFFGEDLMTSDVSPNCDGSKTEVAGTVLTDYWSAADVVESVLTSFGQLNGSRTVGYNPAFLTYVNPAKQDPNAKIAILESVIMTSIILTYKLQFRPDFIAGNNATLIAQMQACTDLFAESTYTRAEIAARFAKTYKAVVVTMDTWDFAMDLESDPDEEDKEAPFIEDPKDVYDSFKFFNGFLNEEYALVDAMIYSLLQVNNTLYTMKKAAPYSGDWWAWQYINGTMGAVVQGLLQKTYPTTWASYWGAFSAYGFLKNMVDMFVDALLAPEGNHPLQGGTKGLLSIKPFFQDAAPTQSKEYLALMLQIGLPAHQSVDKWLAKLIDLFDVDEDSYYGDNLLLYSDIKLMWPALPTSAAYSMVGVPVTDDLAKGGISSDGLVVTVDYEWAEPLLNNPLDIDSQRDDYSIVYTYSDTGAQSKKEFFAGDTLFYQIESIAPTIPGYEVSILLGAAAIATLGLIFVVIKKRRM